MSLAPDSPERGSARGGLKLLQHVERLIVEALPVLDKIPRAQRYRYGARLEGALYGLIDAVVAAHPFVAGVVGALVGPKFVPGLTRVEKDHCQLSFESDRRGAQLPDVYTESP